MTLPPSDNPTLSPCVPVVLESLGWKGSPTTMAEYLFLEADWTLGELLDRLDEAGLGSVHGKARVRALAAGTLLRDRQGTYHAIGQPVEGGVRVFSGAEGTWSVLGPLDLNRLARGAWTVDFEEAEPAQESKVGPFWVQDFWARHRDALGATLVFSLVLAGFGPLSPQFVGLLYQEITTMTHTSGLLSLGLGALLFAMGEVLFLTLRQSLLSRMKRDVAQVLSREVVRRILSFPLVMSQNLETEAQYARIREFEDLAEVLGRPVFRAMVDLPFMAVLLVYLGLTGRAMVLVPLVTIAIFGLAAIFAHPLLKKLEQEAAVGSLQVQVRLDAVLEQGRALRDLGLDEHWKAHLQGAEAKTFPQTLEKARVTAVFQNFGSALVSLAGIAAVLTGVGEVLSGHLAQGALMASMMLIWRILDPFRSIFVLLGSLETTAAALGRLGKFMAIAGESRLEPSRPALPLGRASLRVDGFYFKYPTSPRFALANVSFDVEPLTTMVVSGPPGSGKSTLALALLGLVEGSSGRILVGDQNIRQYHSMGYRRAVSSLPARVPLLPATLRDNLLVARADATDDELTAALDQVGLATVVKGLSEGLDTRLDEEFHAPVPDFTRCLGWARLVLRPSPLWILDDPEQGLTPTSRDRLVALVRSQRGRRTVVLLTSDGEFQALADQRARLDQGRLILEAPTIQEAP